MQAELCIFDDNGDVAVGVVEFRASGALRVSLPKRDTGSRFCPLAGSVFVVQLVLVLFDLPPTPSLMHQ